MTGKVRLPAVNVETVTGICTDSTDPARWTVHDGPAPNGTDVPFVSVYPLAHSQQGKGLAVEDWGTLDAVFQVSCFGDTVDQARWMAEQVITADWPIGWDLAEIVDPVSDDAAAPVWVFFPLTFRYHG